MRFSAEQARFSTEQRNLDSADQLYLYLAASTCDFPLSEHFFSAEQAHVNPSYKTAADWLELARLCHITRFMIGCFLM